MHQKNIKVLVTGGAGYVGSHTVVALARSGYVPIIVDNFINSKLVNIQRIERLIKQPLKVYQSDCKDEKSLVKIFALEKNVAGVIHFAGFKSVRESMLFPQAYYMNNLGAMNTVLGLSKRMGVKYFILSSSCTVYGIQRRLPVDEKVVWGTAQSPYGLIKQASERMLAKTCRGSTWLKGIALRYFNPIGAHPSGTLGEDSLSKFQNFVPVLMRVAAGEIKKVAILGDDYPTRDGTCVRDYVHVMDVADAHVRALQFLIEGKSHKRFDAFNIGLGQGYTVMEMLRECEAVTGQKIRFSVSTKAAGDIAAIYADVDKAHRYFDFRAQYSIQTALKDAWGWQQWLRRKSC